MKTIIIGQHIIKTDAFESITLHPDLPIILFCGGDLYYDDVLQIPMTFQNRLFAREAMERIDTGTSCVDLSDLPCEWPWAASEEIIRYLFRTQKERKEYTTFKKTVTDKVSLNGYEAVSSSGSKEELEKELAVEPLDG